METLKKVRVMDGASLRMPDGSVKSGGDVLELTDELIAMHAGRVEPLPAEPVKAVKQ